MLDFSKFGRKRKSESADLYFEEPLLKMSYVSRLLVHVVTNSWVIVHFVLTILFLLTDVKWAFWLGVLSTLYFIDKFIRYSKPEKLFQKSHPAYGNIAEYMSPKAKRAIISAYNKATVLGGGFFLNLARVLSESRQIVDVLARLGVDAKEFNAKLDAYLSKDLVSYRDEERLRGEVEEVAFTAFENRDEFGRSIDYATLFVALENIKNEPLVSLFGVFEVERDAIKRAAYTANSKEK